MLHIITPASRPYNLPILYMTICQAKIKSLSWEICMYKEQYDKTALWIIQRLNEEDWINFHIIDKCKDGDDCYYKINAMLDSTVNDDYYTFLPDDQLIAPKHLKAIADATLDSTNMAIIITGLATWQNPTAIALIADPTNMRVTGIDIAQITIKGEVAKRHQFNINTHVADGEFAIYLLKNEKPILYLPFCTTLYNALRETWWTPEELKKCFDSEIIRFDRFVDNGGRILHSPIWKND